MSLRQAENRVRIEGILSEINLKYGSYQKNGRTVRDRSVVFEIASKYCILDSFVDHDGYSISSEVRLVF